MTAVAKGSLSRYFTLLAEATDGLRDMTLETIQAVRNASGKKKAVYAATAAALLGTTAMALYIYGPAAVAVQGLGFAGYAIGLAAARLQYNKHVLSTYPVTGAMICVHKAMLDAWSYSLMNAVAGARGGIMSVLPNDENGQKLRYKVGIAFAAVSLPPMAALGIYQSPWSFLNMFGSAASTLADSMTSSEGNKYNDRSHYARLLRISTASFNLAYSIGFSYSLSSIMFCGFLLRNLGKSVSEYDWPVQELTTNRPLSTRESFTRYAAFIIRGKPTHALTRAELKLIKEKDALQTKTGLPIPAPAP